MFWSVLLLCSCHVFKNMVSLKKKLFCVVLVETDISICYSIFCFDQVWFQVCVDYMTRTPPVSLLCFRSSWQMIDVSESIPEATFIHTWTHGVNLPAGFSCQKTMYSVSQSSLVFFRVDPLCADVMVTDEPGHKSLWRNHDTPNAAPSSDPRCSSSFL